MLTDIALRALKPEKAAYKKSDGKGLFVTIHPSGKKVWGLAVRVNGKQKFLTGGRYPDVTVKLARAWRDTVKAQLALGMAPTATPHNLMAGSPRNEVATVGESFETVAREWFDTRKVAWTPRYAAITMRRLEGDIFPFVGALPIAAITPRQMLEAFRAIQARGSVEMAHRVRNHCSEVFRYAIPDGRCESDPCRDLAPGMAKPAPVKHHAKVAAKDLPEFFRKLNLDGGDRTSHLALRWTMVTMVRTQETRFAQWAEFEGLDSDEPIWRIPPERMKMSTEHIVPLPPQAVALLHECGAACKIDPLSGVIGV